jgi:hypothetical protein
MGQQGRNRLDPVHGWCQATAKTASVRNGHGTGSSQGDNVKAYPEVVFGHKPGYPQINHLDAAAQGGSASLQTIVVDYDVQTEREGAGNLAIDMWLTSVPNPNTFAAPPITHEVMIWLEVFGPMYAPAGSR